MDTEILARYRAYLVLIVATIIIFLAVAPQPAYGQMGSCPDLDDQLMTPPGTYPGAATICKQGDDDKTETFLHDDMPCGGGIRVWADWIFPSGDHQPIKVMPPASQTFPSGKAKLSFLVSGWITAGYDFDDVQYRIESYTSGGIRLASTIIGTNDYIQVVTPDYPCVQVLCPPQAEWALVDFVELSAAQGGWIEITMTWPPYGHAREWLLSSIRLWDSLASAPPLCTIPGAEMPTPTPTPGPTSTPPPTSTPEGPTLTPTITPTPTDGPSPTPTITPTATLPPTATSTAWPTQEPPDETWTPQATNTPQQMSTRPAESTPTPFAMETMPAITIPGINYPGVGGVPTARPFELDLTPDATGQARATQMSSGVATVGAVVTRWLTPSVDGIGYMSTTVTTTTGISTPIEIVDSLIADLTRPIAFVKFTGLYMPNTWPLILFILLAVTWVFFNLIVKYGIAIVAETLEVLRKIVDLVKL